MSYAQLDSPLPGLTVSPTGERCCGARGSHLGMLGDESVLFDTTYTDPGGTLIDPTLTDSSGISPIIDSPNSIFATDVGNLPLPNQLSPSLDSLYPQTVGTEFTSNGDGTYTNLQTGQIVPYSIAEKITQATTGPGTANLQTTPTESNLTIADPNTGHSTNISTNNLSVAAQALQAAGQLVNAAGTLTAQGHALLNQGNLYRVPPSTGLAANFSGAVSSLTSWFTKSSLISGFPNYGVVGIAVLAAIALPTFLSSAKRRRR